MRHTTRFSLAALMFLGACMAPESDDPHERPDGGTETKKCDHPTEVTTPVTIRGDADFDKLPHGCWDLFSTLRIESTSVGSLAKLGQLQGVNNLEIVDTGLKSLDTVQPFTVYGSVSITGNQQLASIANLRVDNADNLTTSYVIRNNKLLASLDGIKYIKTSEGELRIEGNDALADITLDELTLVQGPMTIASNGATHLGLGTLQTVKGDFTLRGNTKLTSLGTMGSLQRVEGTLTIDGMNGLTTLDGFTGMQFITNQLVITNNTALTTLGRMSHLSGIGTTVTLTGNTALPYCLAHEIDHCVQSGVVTISNNKANTQTATCTCWCATSG